MMLYSESYDIRFPTLTIYCTFTMFSQAQAEEALLGKFGGNMGFLCADMNITEKYEHAAGYMAGFSRISIYLSIYLSLSISIYLSLSIYLYLSLYLSIYLSIYV